MPLDQTKLEAAAVWVPLAELKPWKDNPRKNASAVDEVARAIKRFGWSSPIVARKADGEIIAGHTRYEAARRLGLPQVPVRFLDLDPADAHLLAVADNKLGEIAEWDDDKLVAVLRDLRDQDIDLTTGTGLDDADLAALLDDGDAGGAGDDDASIDRPAELQRKWATEVGQIWSIPSRTASGRAHRVACGDCTDRAVVERLMADERAAWMWSDPPYGVSYVGKTGDALEIKNDGAEDLPHLLARSFATADTVLLDGAPIYIAHPAGPLSIHFAQAFVGAGWHFHETLIWAKDVFVLGHSDYHYRHEPLLYGWKGGRGARPWFGGRDKDTLLEFARPSRSEMHPTMKPVELIAHCLQNSSARGALGFEPFAGSGSTLVAAEQLGRVCYGVELDPRYVAVVLERLAAVGLTPERL